MKTLELEKDGLIYESYAPPRRGNGRMAKDVLDAADILTGPSNESPVVPAEFPTWEVTACFFSTQEKV